jgi:hypothetical protein
MRMRIATMTMLGRERKGSRETFREEICLAWGPSGKVGGTAPASPIASNFVDGRNNNVAV